MSRVVLNESGLNHLLKAPQGPVAQFLRKKAAQIHGHAFTNISTLTVRRTGDLLGSLKMVEFDNQDGHHIAVGADAIHTHGKSGPFPYARALETGFDPRTGASMGYKRGHLSFAYMIPAVKQSGFRQRA